MSDNTIFEKILSGEIPCEKVFENDFVIAFKDINPQAKEHYLFIHREKSLNINDMVRKKPAHFNQLFKAIEEFTSSNKLEQEGFRVVSNVNRNGGQTVFYTHLHVLGGEPLGSFGR